MPFVLVIIGIIAVVGFGGYYLTGPKSDTMPVETPTARVEESAPTAETATPTPAETNTAVPTTPNPTTPTSPQATTPTTPEAAANTFKNGTYEVTTTYVAPSRTTHEVNVSLTLSDDIVTASTVTYSGETADASTNYQKKFSDAYKAQVVGKSLESISLSRVGGASLTTGAFNKALVEVAADAKI